VAAMRADDVHLLDWSMDEDLNRSVVTIDGEPAAVAEAAVRQGQFERLRNAAEKEPSRR